MVTTAPKSEGRALWAMTLPCLMVASQMTMKSSQARPVTLQGIALTHRKSSILASRAHCYCIHKEFSSRMFPALALATRLSFCSHHSAKIPPGHSQL